MLIFVSTGERESDLVITRGILEKEKAFNKTISFDCELENELNAFLTETNSIPLFAKSQSFVVHNLKYEKSLDILLSKSELDIIFVSPSGKWKHLKEAAKLINEPLDEKILKSQISKALKEHSIELDRYTTERIFSMLSTKGYTGKSRLSPLQTEIFIRRINSLEGADNKKLVEELLDSYGEEVNQWKMLDYLFTTNKLSQIKYFVELSKNINAFELISTLKSSLFLVLAILTGLDSGISAPTIASKLKKHPFYISNIVTTIKDNSITVTRAKNVLTRLMNLELALKSGKFEDEQFGFEVLLATS